MSSAGMGVPEAIPEHPEYTIGDVDLSMSSAEGDDPRTLTPETTDKTLQASNITMASSGHSGTVSAHHTPILSRSTSVTPPVPLTSFTNTSWPGNTMSPLRMSHLQTPAAAATATPESGRPLPDQSVFESGQKVAQSLSFNHSPSPKAVCPPTPARTPAWAARNSLPLRRMNSLSVTKTIFDVEDGTTYEGHENFRFKDMFDNLGRLGKGSFSEVFEARWKRDGKKFAVKRNLELFRSKRDRDIRLDEFRVARLIGEHPNVMRYYKAWQEDGHMLFQMELCERGNVQQYRERHGSALPEDAIWAFVASIANGLHRIHSLGLVHLDIKPENALLTKDGHIKIGDLGLCHLYKTPPPGAVGATPIRSAAATPVATPQRPPLPPFAAAAASPVPTFTPSTLPPAFTMASPSTHVGAPLTFMPSPAAAAKGPPAFASTPVPLFGSVTPAVPSSSVMRRMEFLGDDDDAPVSSDEDSPAARHNPRVHVALRFSEPGGVPPVPETTLPTPLSPHDLFFSGLRDHPTPAVPDFSPRPSLDLSSAAVLDDDGGPEGDSRYIAPEVFEPGAKKPPCDIFSLGLSVFELVWDMRLPNTAEEWTRGLREGRFPPINPALRRSDDLIRMVKHLTAPDPAKRPTAAQILQHPEVRRAMDVDYSLPTPMEGNRQLTFEQQRHGNPHHHTFGRSGSIVDASQLPVATHPMAPPAKRPMDPPSLKRPMAPPPIHVPTAGAGIPVLLSPTTSPAPGDEAFVVPSAKKQASGRPSGAPPTHPTGGRSAHAHLADRFAAHDPCTPTDQPVMPPWSGWA